MAAPNRLTVPLDPAGGPGADAPHYHMAVGPARAGAVPIRKPTHHARTTMCKTRQGSMHTWPRSRFTRSWLAIPCGRLQLRTAQPSRRRRTGRHRRGGERPPSPRAWYGRGAECVFTPSAPALQGSLPVQVSLAGRQTPRQSSRPWQTRSPFGRPWRCSGPGRSPARCAGGSWLPQLGRSRYILVRSLAETPAEQSCLLPRSPG